MFTQTRLSIYIITLVLLLAQIQSAQSQQFVFARLDGSPTMNTMGWSLGGAATTGDTGGDADSDPNELIICQPVTNNVGYAFFNSPVHLNTCNRWTAEFDYRIWDGSAADGMAFCLAWHF